MEEFYAVPASRMYNPGFRDVTKENLNLLDYLGLSTEAVTCLSQGELLGLVELQLNNRNWPNLITERILYGLTRLNREY